MSNQFLKPGSVERLDTMLDLREQLDAKNQQCAGRNAFDEHFLPTIRQFIATSKHLNDWPLIICCCQSYQRYLQDVDGNNTVWRLMGRHHTHNKVFLRHTRGKTSQN